MYEQNIELAPEVLVNIIWSINNINIFLKSNHDLALKINSFFSSNPKLVCSVNWPTYKIIILIVIITSLSLAILTKK